MPAAHVRKKPHTHRERHQLVSCASRGARKEHVRQMCFLVKGLLTPRAVVCIQRCIQHMYLSIYPSIYLSVSLARPQRSWHKQVRGSPCRKNMDSSVTPSLWDYPQTLTARLWEDPLLKANFAHLLAAGVIHTSDYAGIDMNRETFRLLNVASQHALRKGISYVLHRSCDSGPLQRRLLTSVARQWDSSRSCVHNDIVDRLPAELKCELQTLLPLDTATVDEKQDAYAKIETLLEERKSSLGTNIASYCSVHERMCPLSLSRSRQRQYRDAAFPEVAWRCADRRHFKIAPKQRPTRKTHIRLESGESHLSNQGVTTGSCLSLLFMGSHIWEFKV